MKNTDIDINKLRMRLANDRDFAERFFGLITELSDFSIDEISTAPKLNKDRDNDPGAIIVKMEGHDNNGHPIIMVLVEPKEELMLMMRAYTAWLWEPYNPITDEDFESLPKLYEITFDDETTEVPDCPILHIRTRLSHMEADGWVTDDKEIDDGVYINLINMNAENSEILELLKDVMKDV